LVAAKKKKLQSSSKKVLQSNGPALGNRMALRKSAFLYFSRAAQRGKRIDVGGKKREKKTPRDVALQNSTSKRDGRKKVASNLAVGEKRKKKNLSRKSLPYS